MPMYEYLCNSCQETFKEFYMIDDRKIPEGQPCPSCGKYNVQHKIGAPPIAYDGAGRQHHSNDFNDYLKDMRKKLPKDEKLPIDDTIR